MNTKKKVLLRGWKERVGTLDLANNSKVLGFIIIYNHIKGSIQHIQHSEKF